MSEYQTTIIPFDPSSSGTPAPTGINPSEGSLYGDQQLQNQQPKLQVRLLIEERRIGGIIGKSGAVINKLRSDTDCKVNITDGMQGAKHGIVTVVGVHDQVANCLFMIADRLYGSKRGAEGPERRGEYTTYEVKSSGEVGIDACHLVLLVPNNQVGAMIGKGGAKVNAIRQSSGAQIKISEKPLADSTEKSVTIVGSLKVMQSALQQICAHLNDECDKVATTPYVPRSPEYDDYGWDTFRGGDYRREGRKRKQWPEDDYYRGGYPEDRYRGDGYGGSRGGGGPFRGGPPPPPSSGPPQPPQTLVVPVQNYIMGTVIGRNGASINEIRNRSGAQIKIAPLESGATDRMVTITGTPQANEAAIAMIHQKMAEHGTPPS